MRGYTTTMVKSFVWISANDKRICAIGSDQTSKAFAPGHAGQRKATMILTSEIYALVVYSVSPQVDRRSRDEKRNEMVPCGARVCDPGAWDCGDEPCTCRAAAEQ